MVSLDDVAAMALAMDGVTEDDRRGGRTWSVDGRVFVWERAYSKADLRRFGDEPYPQEPIVAVRVADLHEKEAILAAGRPGFFTIEHFNGYAAVLVELRRVRKRDLRELLTDGWQAARGERRSRPRPVTEG